MKIALFGGSGFIGNSVLDILNHNLLTYVEISRSPVSVHQRTADICNFDSLQRIQESFDTVIICSSRLPQKRYMPDDLVTFTETNIMGVNNILRWASQRGVSKIIYCSTLSLLPFFNDSNDESPLMDITSHYVYKTSKAAAEHFLLGFCKDQGIDYCSLRIAAVYGPRMKSDLIHHFIGKIKKGEKIVIENVNLMADFVHVDDVVNTIMACLNQSVSNQIINVGSGAPIRLTDLVAQLARVMNAPLPPLEIKSEVSLPHKKYSVERMQRMIAPLTPLEKGLRQLVQPE